MKPWMIVLSSAFVAIAAAVGVAMPVLSLTAHSGIMPKLIPLLPALVVTALAGYALGAILLTMGSLVVNCLLLRHRVAGGTVHRGPVQPDWLAQSGWFAAFEASGLRRLMPALAVPPRRSARADRTIVVQSRFRPQEARREMARLYHIGAARSHFFSALIVLTGAAALGVAQQHGALPQLSGRIPTVPAALILVGLVLLAVLGRLAVDVAVEPLVELLSQLPAEPVEVALLRRAVELLEAGPAANPAQDDGALASVLQIPDRVVGVFEDGRRALFDAIEHLSATTDGLALSTRSAIEGLEAAVRESERHQPPATDGPTLDAAGVSRLEEAVVALTAALERAPASVPVGDRPAGPDSAILGREADPHLADELKKLLQEIGTAS